MVQFPSETSESEDRKPEWIQGGAAQPGAKTSARDGFLNRPEGEIKT